MGSYTVRKNLFENAGSGLTSAVYWVGDARRMSLMCDGSVQTVIATNQEGRDAALSMDTLNWSTLTRMVAQRALMDIEPGFRWLCVQRSGSSGTAILELQQLA